MSDKEQLPTLELMRQCFEAGRRTSTQWAVWFNDNGVHVVAEYHEHMLPEALLDSAVGWSEYQRLHAKLDTLIMQPSSDVHTVVAANNAMLILLCEALSDVQPDEVVDKEGEVWTIQATANSGDELVHVVQARTMTAAIEAAVLHWSVGAWETLSKRSAKCAE